MSFAHYSVDVPAPQIALVWPALGQPEQAGVHVDLNIGDLALENFAAVLRLIDQGAIGAVSLDRLAALIEREHGMVILRNSPYLQGPAGMVNLRNLLLLLHKVGGVRHLDIEGNHLGMLPLELFALRGLVWLSIAGNDLPSLPPEIAELTGLRGLNATNNQLTTLPAQIAHLPHLIWLMIERNQITDFPEELGGLPSLGQLSLDASAIDRLPTAIIERANAGRCVVRGYKA